jgi:putative Holliday junction resolvase
MRAVGLDLGTKTIGIAVSDELGLTAQGLKTLERRSLKKDLADLVALAAELGADRFVLGLPLNMDGSEGPRAQATRKFGAALEAESHLPIHYQDERLTTVAAERALLEADLSRKKRREVIDQVAATLILQAWLEARPRSPSTSQDRPQGPVDVD